MGLVPLQALLGDARNGGYALGYFEAWDLASLEAVLEAAEAEHAPVVLGFGCLLVDQGWLDRGGIEALGRIGSAVAERAAVPACLLLNETHTVAHAIRGLDAGFDAVMLHTTGALDSVPDVRAVVEAARARGAAVEGELGVLAEAHDAAIVESGSVLTDPAEAATFVEETGVDCLAVSCGNVHTLEGRSADVDLDLLAEIHRRVDVPLAVHGGTSFPREAVAAAVARGVAKFNVGTVLKRAFLEGLGDAVGSRGEAGLHELVGSHGPADLVEAGARRIVPVVRDLIRLYGSSERAA